MEIKRILKEWKLIVLLAALVTVAGLANGVMDTLTFHYSSSIFPQREGQTLLGAGPQFWNPGISWKNKYKDFPDDPRPRYPGATTWLAWTTDAWHLAQMIMLTAFQLAILIPMVYFLRLRWYWLLLGLFSWKLLFGIGFSLMYYTWLR